MVWWIWSEPVGNHYPDFEALDGNTKLIECEDMSQDDGITIRRDNCTNVGRRLRPEHVPTKIEWRSRSKIPDVTSPYIAFAVSLRFREIVEELEPGVHQWLPVEYVDKKGKHLADRYYFIPCNRLDSVDHDRTTMVLYKGRLWTDPKSLRRTEPELLPPDYSPEARVRYVFSEAKTSGFHAWCDKRIGIFHVLISDQLAEALRAEKITGLALRKEESA